MTTEYPNQLAIALHGYFADYLPRLRGMSPNTIESYRDSLVLLLRFLALHHQCSVSSLEFDSIDPAGIIHFLNYLEKERNSCTATRNVRLSAIHAFFRYVASQHPDRLEQAQRVLGIPFKRAKLRPIEYLEYNEMQALLNSVDRTSIDGRRDYALLAAMFNTGARVQEIIDLRARDLYLSKPYQVRLFGKGRKERFCPLWSQTAQVIRSYVKERKLDLKAGVDLSTIGQWLGHSSVNTTNKYATIDLEMKRDAIARARPVGNCGSSRWRKNESILTWLEAL